MNTKSSTVCAVLGGLVLVSIALFAATPAHAAGEDWTCSGAQSAVCIAKLTAERCAVRDQTCFLDDKLLGHTDCACAPVCEKSADCGSSEACYKSHCWPSLSCNSIVDCPVDATCFEGACRKLGACNADSVAIDCNSSAPDCIDGTCGTLLPGQCNIDSDCGADPCAGPARCDARTHRCIRTGPPPCAGIARARCFASSRTDFQCFVPACTSDAQCEMNACEGAQRCDRPTGRCIPVQPACNEAAGEFCQALSLTAHQCLLTAPHLPWGHIDNSPVITQPDLTLIPVVGVPSGAGAGRFVLTGMLPASALAKGAPSAVSVVVTTGEREVLVDASLIASGKSSAWTFDAKSGAWRWASKDPAARIDRVVIQPSGQESGELSFEIVGRLLALSGRGKVGPAKAPYGAEVWLQGAGADAKPIRNSIAFPECKDETAKGATLTVCTGKASP